MHLYMYVIEGRGLSAILTKPHELSDVAKFPPMIYEFSGFADIFLPIFRAFH